MEKSDAKKLIIFVVGILLFFYFIFDLIALGNYKTREVLVKESGIVADKYITTSTSGGGSRKEVTTTNNFTIVVSLENGNQAITTSEYWYNQKAIGDKAIVKTIHVSYKNAPWYLIHWKTRENDYICKRIRG